MLCDYYSLMRTFYYAKCNIVAFRLSLDFVKKKIIKI